MYGSDVSYTQRSSGEIAESLIIQKDDDGRASNFVQPQWDLNVKENSVIGKGCSFTWNRDNSTTNFTELTIESNACLRLSDPGDKTGHDKSGGQHTTMTISGTLHAPSTWTIQATASDN